MKQLKKVLALTLALTMLLALTVTASADGAKWSEEETDDGWIEVTNEGGKTLGYSPDSGVTLIEDDGFAFKDLNRSGALEPYEDWRLDNETRAREDASFNGVVSFLDYVEGIYMGYKFYETAAEEGLIDFESTVQFPFGYGVATGTELKDTSAATCVIAMRKACKNILYTVGNSGYYAEAAAANREARDAAAAAASQTGMSKMDKLFVGVDVGVGVVVLGLEALVLLRWLKKRKAALLQGWSMWTTLDLREKGVAPLFLSDGPHGLRKQPDPSESSVLTGSVPATCFPTAATMANAWNLALGEELGAALGEEAAANGVHVLLGPGLNIKRSPLCGRNFEYFSEDPFLAGKMAAAYIRGIQSKGVAACPKHFAVNSQELRRLSVDAVLDERTLREIYLTGFEIAITEGKPLALMSAYNRVNGVYCNENAHLLRDILRGEWGFEGFVVSDWGADNDHVEGVRAGSNLVMPAPGPDCAIQLVEAVREGRLAESALDERLRELLKVMARTQPAVARAPKSFDREALALSAAQQALIAAVCAVNPNVVLVLSGGAPFLLPKCGYRAVIHEHLPQFVQIIPRQPVRTDERGDQIPCAAVMAYAVGQKRNGASFQIDGRCFSVYNTLM